MSYVLKSIVDRGRCAAPVFMDLQTCHACFALVMKSRNSSITSLADDSVIEWEVVASLHHTLDVVLPWRTIRCDGSRASVY